MTLVVILFKDDSKADRVFPLELLLPRLRLATVCRLVVAAEASTDDKGAAEVVPGREAKDAKSVGVVTPAACCKKGLLLRALAVVVVVVVGDFL